MLKKLLYVCALMSFVTISGYAAEQNAKQNKPICQEKKCEKKCGEDCSDKCDEKCKEKCSHNKASMKKDYTCAEDQDCMDGKTQKKEKPQPKM